MTVLNEKMIMKRKTVYSHWGQSIGIILHFVVNPIWLLPDAENILSTTIINTTILIIFKTLFVYVLA